MAPPSSMVTEKRVRSEESAIEVPLLPAVGPSRASPGPLEVAPTPPIFKVRSGDESFVYFFLFSFCRRVVINEIMFYPS